MRGCVFLSKIHLMRGCVFSIRFVYERFDIYFRFVVIFVVLWGRFEALRKAISARSAFVRNSQCSSARSAAFAIEAPSQFLSLSLPRPVSIRFHHPTMSAAYGEDECCWTECCWVAKRDADGIDSVVVATARFLVCWVCFTDEFCWCWSEQKSARWCSCAGLRSGVDPTLGGFFVLFCTADRPVAMCCGGAVVLQGWSGLKTMGRGAFWLKLKGHGASVWGLVIYWVTSPCLWFF